MSPSPTRLLLPVVAVLVLAGCQSRHGNRPRLGEVERLPHLETIRPERHDRLAVRKTYLATVEAFERADLCAQVRGLVRTLPADIDIGRPIKEGEPLVVLDIPDLLAERETKRAMLEQARNLIEQAAQAQKVAAEEVNEALALENKAQADLEFRDVQYARVTRLVQGDTVAQQLADEAKLQRGAAQAALTAARAQAQTRQAKLQAAAVEIKVAESRVKVAQSELSRLEATVGYATVRAPFDGVITKRWVDRGATVKDPGMPLLSVVRTDKVRVILDVPEQDVPFLHRPGGSGTTAGNPVEVSIPALQRGDAEQVIHGYVSATAAALDPVTRTMRTEVHLANPAGTLKPQMTGTATVLLAERVALTVPSSALVRDGSRVDIYYIADPTGDPPRGVVKRLEVRLALDDGRRVEILSDKITGRELVIAKGNGVVRAGERAIAVPLRKE